MRPSAPAGGGEGAASGLAGQSRSRAEEGRTRFKERMATLASAGTFIPRRAQGTGGGGTGEEGLEGEELERRASRGRDRRGGTGGEGLEGEELEGRASRGRNWRGGHNTPA